MLPLKASWNLKNKNRNEEEERKKNSKVCTEGNVFKLFQF